MSRRKKLEEEIEMCPYCFELSQWVYECKAPADIYFRCGNYFPTHELDHCLEPLRRKINHSS
jgi:hypothetical protein